MRRRVRGFSTLRSPVQSILAHALAFHHRVYRPDQLPWQLALLILNFSYLQEASILRKDHAP
jgi:hypothetical protein